MTDDSGQTDRVRTPTAAEPEGAWYRRFIVVGLVLAIAVAWTAFAIGQGGAQLPIRALAYLGLPPAIALAVVASRGNRLNWLVLAVILIDVEALLVSALLAMGLALAVLFPLIGLALVLERLRGRALGLAFVSAGLTTVAGILVALLFGPVSQAQPLRDHLLVAATASLFVILGLVPLYRLNSRRAAALDAARAELASRRAAEAELDRTSQLLAAIVNSSPVPIHVLGSDAKLLVWNPASERVFGWTAAEVVGNEVPVEMTAGEERAEWGERFERALRGDVVHGDRLHATSKDGRDVWVDVYSTALRDSEGKPIGIASQLVDATDRVALEASLVQAAKMEAIGGLAGGIAHDFNNILTAIRGHAELVRMGLAPDSPDRADLDEIILAADKAAGLTRQLLAFARRTVLEPRVLDPTAVVVAFAPMLRRLMGEDVELVLDLEPGTGHIKADPVQLEQVILNLAVNSRDAMPMGGTLRVAMRNVDLDARAAAKHTDARPGSYVEVSVADTGTGINKTVQSRVFEPFFTTKEPGKGTGMGLATVVGIVRAFEGWIDLRSMPGRGATFRLYFPRVEPAGPAEEAPAHAGAVEGGSETILLVEDDEAVRAFSHRCLADLGYTLLEAASGPEALNLAGAHDGPIDLLLSDVVMPGLRGPELARRLHKQRPGLKTVLCSGFAGDEVAEGEGSRDTYLAKPYSAEALGRAVRTALDRPS